MEMITTPKHAYATLPVHEFKLYERVNGQLMTTLPIIRMQDAWLHAITEKQTIDTMMDEIAAGRGGCVVTMNLDHMRRYDQDRAYRDLCEKATLHVADGMPLVWASRIQGTPLPERVTGSNMIWSLTEATAANGHSIFLIGGAPGTADGAADVLCDKFPALNIVGTLCPPHGFEHDTDELAKIARTLIAAKPDIVYVALGSPKQDKLIETLRDYLPNVWWVGVGISFSFVTGQVSRAPQWMQNFGFEWLHRLAQEPRRLAARYLLHGLPFCIKLFADAFGRRITGS